MNHVRVRAAATALLVALTVVVAPRVAEACPVCAGNEEGGYGRIILLGLMILFPFGIVAAIIHVLRSAQGAAPVPAVDGSQPPPTNTGTNAGVTGVRG